MLTIIIAAWTIATALPLGLLLALARRSELPPISLMAGAFIDLMRSLPLVGILFLMIVMFPLFVPPGVETDKLMRVLVAFTLFNAAIFAEVFRGGLAGHSERTDRGRRQPRLAAMAGHRPDRRSAGNHDHGAGLVNLCIAIIKETTIVLIVGLVRLCRRAADRNVRSRLADGDRACAPPPTCSPRRSSGRSAFRFRATAAASSGGARTRCQRLLGQDRLDAAPDRGVLIGTRVGGKPHVVGDLRRPPQHDDAVADRQRLADRMGDEHRRLAVLRAPARRTPRAAAVP